jgi:hypothetical protein
MLRRKMVKDESTRGLLVHPDWWEPEHPQEKPIKLEDPIAIRRPASRLDKAQDSYGPDERVDDTTFDRRPSLALSLSIGPYEVEIV